MLIFLLELNFSNLNFVKLYTFEICSFVKTSDNFQYFVSEKQTNLRRCMSWIERLVFCKFIGAPKTMGERLVSKLSQRNRKWVGVTDLKVVFF